MAMTLMEHQKKVLKDTKDRNLVAYYIDMGGGKTFIGSEKAQSFDEEVILIVCQKSKVRDWVEHFFTYYIDQTKCDESGAWCYDLTRDDKDLGMFFHSRYKKRIGVINYDLIFRRPALKKLENWEKDSAAVNEEYDQKQKDQPVLRFQRLEADAPSGFCHTGGIHIPADLNHGVCIDQSGNLKQ